MLMMTSAQVVETSVNVTSNSPSKDYTHPDNHNLLNYDDSWVQTIYGLNKLATETNASATYLPMCFSRFTCSLKLHRQTKVRQATA